MPEDRLVGSLVSSDRVHRLLVCNHPRSLPLKLLRDLGERHAMRFPSDERTHLLEPRRLRRSDPTSIRAVERAFAAFERAIERATHKYGLRNPVVITAHPLLAGFATLDWARAVTFYATDDWAQHPAFRPWWPVFEESYARIRDRRRRVAAVSSVLLERLDPLGRTAVVPNGLDPAEWGGDARPPDWVATASRPLLVYAGMLDSRIDVEWLSRLAREEHAATIVLAGRVVEHERMAVLRALPNVRFTELLPRGAVTGLVRAADAGLLPHVRSPLTAAMSPLKLFEYLAAGLPVAATDLPPVRELRHPGIVLVPPGGDFVEGVRAALARGRAPEQDRAAFIDRHSWRSRHDQLLDVALAA